MADYFTNFSLILKLPDQAAKTYALELAHKASAHNQGDETEPLPASIKEVVEDWSFEIDPFSHTGEFGLWLHSQYGGVDAVAAFIQHLLQRFEPDGCVSFQWSNDCSKPRVDAFGGGAVIITANNIKSMTTGEWLGTHSA